MSRTGLVAAVVAVWVSVGVSARGATPKQVDNAIRKGVAWVYGQQNEKGNWETVPGLVADFRKEQSKTEGGQWGGLSALATYALLDAGESPRDERVVKAVEFLNRAPLVGTYAIALRAQIWQYLPWDTMAKQGATRDASMLLNGVKGKGEAKGMWSYLVSDPNASRYDHSTSQIALLGLWACDQAGREVPAAFWREAENAWRGHQAEDGSWSYVYQGAAEHGQPRMSMTLAGVATLFITQDYVHLNDGIFCKGNVFDDALVRGTKWIYEKFDPAQLGGGYVLYAMERVGMASGFKYFGEHDWYALGADALVRRQRADGSWGSLTETAFAVIFLSRGRSPVILNKFQYELEGAAPKVAAGAARAVLPKGGPKADGQAGSAGAGGEAGGGEAAPTFDGNWCQRPREVAQFTRWMSKVTERRLNWQIISNWVPVDDFHDAPVLYMSGNQVLTLPKQTRDKLRQYAEEGGLIFGHADCGSKEFTESFVKLGSELFPKYAFRELPPEHPIFTSQQFLRRNWKNPPKVMGLSNGARELMVILPENDIARYWQQGTYQGKEESFQVMNGIVLYAVDRQNLKYRGASHVVRSKADAPDPARVIKVARLEYGGNWNPEPAGWTRLAAILKNQKLAKLTTEPVVLGEGKLDVEKHPFAHLTGTGEFKLTKEQLNDLKRYVIRGGVILCDAAGGESEFGVSIERELLEIIGGSQFEVMGLNDPALKAPGGGGSAADEQMIATTKVRQGGAATQASSQPTTARSILDPNAPAFEPRPKVLLPGGAEVEYRQFARNRMGSNDALRLKAVKFRGRTAIVLSREDLSTGLVGQQVDGINGYAPATATELVRRLVLNLSPVVKKAEPAPQ